MNTLCRSQRVAFSRCSRNSEKLLRSLPTILVDERCDGTTTPVSALSRTAATNRLPRRCSVSIYRLSFEHPPKIEKLPLYSLGLDMGCGPYLVQELVMRHQLSRVVNQIPQHHERLERQWYSFIRSALPFAPETFVDEIKPKWGECLICHS
jgi:hypothetical protein